VAIVERDAALRTGVRLEVFTVAWMAVEAVLAIGAGVAARSLLLTAFGFDSVIELLSGLTLLWWLSGNARMEAVEHRATQISAVLLVLLCAYLVFVGVGGLILRLHPEGSVLGVMVSAAAVVVMPLLAWRKRRVNATLDSPRCEPTLRSRSPAPTWQGRQWWGRPSTSWPAGGGRSTRPPLRSWSSSSWRPAKRSRRLAKKPDERFSSIAGSRAEFPARQTRGCRQTRRKTRRPPTLAGHRLSIPALLGRDVVAA